MELKTYISPLLKWWWLILAAAAVAGISSYMVTRQQPPVFQARTTLVIGRTFYEPNPSSADMLLGEQLAEFYADLAQREPVRTAVVAALGLTALPEYNAQAIPNSQLIEVNVTDTDPRRAQAVANELANQLILQSPTGDQKEEQERHDFINEQLSSLEEQINQNSEDIAKKQEELGNLTSAREISNAQAELAALRTKMTTMQTNYASLLANSQRGARNTLTVIEQAAVPRRPIGPQKEVMVLLATAIGLILASVAAYLLEYLDDTLKTTEDINRITKLPVIGYIADVKREDYEGVYVARKPRSIVAEEFRALRTNISFAEVDERIKTLYITSAGVSEGKSFVSANLAAIHAQGGKKVVLLDADLRRSSVHEILGISNQKGLSDVFRGNISLDEAINYVIGEDFGVIPSGKLPPNPADLISSKKMESILEELMSKADIAIIDGPPFVVSEASVLANKVNGVLLVVRYALTRRGELTATIEKLNQADANVVGVVINGIPTSKLRKYGAYGYYPKYYSDDQDEKTEDTPPEEKDKTPGLIGKARRAFSDVIHVISSEG